MENDISREELLAKIEREELLAKIEELERENTMLKKLDGRYALPDQLYKKYNAEYP